MTSERGDLLYAARLSGRGATAEEHRLGVVYHAVPIGHGPDLCTNALCGRKPGARSAVGWGWPKDWCAAGEWRVTCDRCLQRLPADYCDLEEGKNDAH